MLHPTDPSQNVSREYSSDFEIGECWGYNRFYRIQGIIEEGFIHPDNGTLTLEFFVRASSYAQHCRDQKKYIAELEHEVKGLKEQISNRIEDGINQSHMSLN